MAKSLWNTKMQKFLSREKEIIAEAFTRENYCELRKWAVPENENGADTGFIVVDPNLPINVPDSKFKGHLTWMDTLTFESQYSPVIVEADDVTDEEEVEEVKIFNTKPKTLKVEELTFGEAIEYAKKGFNIARTGWNGNGMFAYIVSGGAYKDNFKPELISKENNVINYQPYWMIKTAQNCVSSWAPSGNDSLAEDWVVITSSTS